VRLVLTVAVHSCDWQLLARMCSCADGRQAREAVGCSQTIAALDTCMVPRVIQCLPAGLPLRINRILNAWLY
jgi:hypothetical protein